MLKSTRSYQRLVWLLLLWNLTADCLLLPAVTTRTQFDVTNGFPLNDLKQEPSRRLFLNSGLPSMMAGVLALTLPLCSHAEDETRAVVDKAQPRKPSAPTEALLPAARCKLWVDKAYKVTTAISNATDKKSQYDLILELNSILSPRPKFFLNERAKKRTVGTTAQLTTSISSANKDQYRSNRADLAIPDRMAAMLNQADVERQWGMLQYAEANREKGNEIRAAFNFYTSQLEFADSYLLTASKEEKKRMIRNDELPTLSAVITSDLDLRDLYRNQFLTSIEDAVAEVAFQAKQGEASVETEDVVDLMKQAYDACQNWFALIPVEDVDIAIQNARTD